MKARHHIQASTKTLVLMLLITCVAAFAAAKLSAVAQAASTDTAATAASFRFPPVEGCGTYECVQPPPRVIRDTIIRFRRASVNSSGVVAKSKTFAQVDETGHDVNSKGARVGGPHE
jgi:hypothetical protein